jgi:nucleotide-binding universal stress UspA family protein
MKKILASLDGSPRQEGILRAACELARRTDAKLPPEPYLVTEPDITTVLERRARVDVAALVKAGRAQP